MKRFIQVILDTFDEITVEERSTFENRCSCAVACGYVPCGNTLQVCPTVTGDGSGDISKGDNGYEGDLTLDINTERRYCLTQAFYDPEGKATLICGQCTKCETCTISPESDVYCSKFKDTCYQEDK